MGNPSKSGFSMVGFTVFTLALAAGTALAAGSATEARAATGTASLSGTVTFDGTAPAMQKIKMNADPACQQQHKDPVLEESVLVNGGKLQNVVVYIKEGIAPGAYPASKTPVVLTQTGCVYQPHVFAIQAGQPLEIMNNDPTLHNINCQPKLNKKFNIAQPTKGMKSSKSFDQPEGVSFKCNVHPWMNAHAVVTNNPFFAVSDANGAFSLANLPASTYTVEAWHEKLGTQTQSVTVADGEAKQVSFSFKAAQ